MKVDKRIAVLDAAGKTVAYLSRRDGVQSAKVKNELNGDSRLSFSLPQSCSKLSRLLGAGLTFICDGRAYVPMNDEAVVLERGTNGLDAAFLLSERQDTELSARYCTVWNDTNGLPRVATHTVMLVSNPSGTISIGSADYDSTQYAAVNGAPYAIPAGLTAGTARYAATLLLQGTGWEVDPSLAAYWPGGIFDLETERRSVRENLVEMQKLWGGFWLFDSAARRCALVDENAFDADAGLSVRYRHSETGMSRTENREIYTRIYAYGSEALTFAELTGGAEYVDTTDAAALAVYGVRETVLQNEDIHNADTLLAWAQKQADFYSHPRTTYEAACLTDEARENRMLAHLCFGGLARIYDADVTGGEVRQRLSAWEYDPLDETDFSATYCDRGDTYTGFLKDLKRASAAAGNVISSSGNISAGNVIFEGLHLDGILSDFKSGGGFGGGFNVLSVAALPADAASHTDTIYLIQGNVQVT